MIMAPYLKAKAEYHPGCEPITFGNTGTVPPDPQVESLKRDLTEVIRWADDNAARSQQVMLGPSELGVNCDRRIAYGVAGIPHVNHYTDPWPAIMGTAIHKWLEEAVNRFQDAAGAQRWITEYTVEPDPLVRGHLDLYDSWLPGPIDWKSLGTTKMQQWKREGPPLKHLQQVNLYGMGLLKKGLKVEKVALVGIPRAGWLDDMTPYVYDYDESLAQAALDRMYRIAEEVMRLGADTRPELMSQIDAEPVKGDCQWCPWFRVRGDGPGCEGK